MKSRNVSIPPFVRHQINEQVLFIAKHSVDNALAWEARLLAEIRRIGEMPGHPIDEDASARLGLQAQKCVFEGTYLIHYTVNKSTSEIEVIGFRHGARKPSRGEP